MNTYDPMLQFLLSGDAHVYYALILGIGIAALILVGFLNPVWLFVPVASMAGIFVDLWLHRYEH